jgi:hypothetical protein
VIQALGSLHADPPIFGVSKVVRKRRSMHFRAKHLLSVQGGDRY